MRTKRIVIAAGVGLMLATASARRASRVFG